MRGWTLSLFKDRFGEQGQPGGRPPTILCQGRLAVLQVVLGAASQLLVLPYPSIFSEAFLAAPAARDMLVSEISLPFTLPTAGVAVYAVTPWGLAAGRIWDGSRVVLRAKCVEQLRGSKSKANRMAEAKKFPQAISQLGTALHRCALKPGHKTVSSAGAGQCPGAALARQRGCLRPSAGLTPAQLAGGGGGLRCCWHPWRDGGAGIGACRRQRAGLRLVGSGGGSREVWEVRASLQEEQALLPTELVKLFELNHKASILVTVI